MADACPVPTCAERKAAETVLARVARLSGISAYPWNLTRRIFSPQQAEAEALVLGWMREAGLTASRDPAGNLIGRIEGAVPGGPAVVIGGHIDTREDACRTDGTLGVLMGIAAAERVAREGASRRHAIEVVAFVVDAAGRFGPPRLGSKAVVGRLDEQVLDWDDDYTVTLRQAMRSHGLDPEAVMEARRADDAFVAYLEVAAEAGPVLERSGAPIGIVPALTGSSILRITLTGQRVNPATVPMSDWRDALTGLADCILDAERIGSARETVTVSVIRPDIEAAPMTTVTGSAVFGIRVLSADEAARAAAVADLEAAFTAIASRRRLEITIERGIDPAATRCDPGIVRLFERAVEASGHPLARLSQGLTTDASNMALLAPIGLALIRCRDGVGWGPAGSVEPADVAVGLNVLADVVGALAGAGSVARSGAVSG